MVWLLKQESWKKQETGPVPPPARQPWLWDGRIPDVALTVLAGERGAGKTAFLLDLVRRIRSGTPWSDGQSMTLPADCGILWGTDGKAEVPADVFVAPVREPMALERQIKARKPRLVIVDCDCPRAGEVAMLSAFARVLGVPIVSTWRGTPHTSELGQVVPALALASSVLWLGERLEVVRAEL